MPPENHTPDRTVASGGLRRILWGFGLGALLGLAAAALSPRPGGPRRSSPGA